MKLRFAKEAPSQAEELWSAAYILMGLRYERAMVQSLLRGVVNMKESSTYQAILEEGSALGEAKEARKMLLLQGRQQFGEPSAKVVAKLQALSDVAQLEAMALRLLQVNSWEELLRVNGSTRHPRGTRKS
jgi:predicted transposase YdaD